MLVSKPKQDYRRATSDTTYDATSTAKKATSNTVGGTGKSMSEALIFASTNPQYDNKLFIELPVQYTKIPSSEHSQNMVCTSVCRFKSQSY